MAPTFPDDIRTPAYVLDAAALKRNLETIARIRREAGCKVLLATKAWAMPAAFPMMRDALDGSTASGEFEARLGREEFGKEVHVYAPAYADGEVERLTAIADHIYFNSPEQIARLGGIAKAAGAKIGARINPGYSNATLGGPLYDPCAPCSRFGTTRAEIDKLPWGEIDIFHVHTLCESLADGSVGLIEHVAREFAPYIRQVEAVNFGGGHFINKPGYDVDKLIAAIKAFRAEFGVEVILEPGGGIVVNAGYLVASVIGLHWNEKNIAILDTSASCHMPDVLEVPYRPTLIGAAESGVNAHDYILGGKTCMTGDVIGEYSFAEPLQLGSRIVFTDMMQYSFVKNTTFNGTPRPDLAVLEEDGSFRVVRSFGYEDYRHSLG
ncbi:carboxynorspermidine decarboxylase [Hyphomicrobium sp. xq]|uniref:Carboxynorspermidine/carboxyspermidine decarboxylase n=1 Tax=Hyphomicrobium album TaxID=2665159 RepID=A0A6I3KKE4_9HYPH|nr:carboxynorspermidine decarboxylase [Hyphomicrobium album]MTD95594.1 carboxynorspermidine decarboxylase [Hyphomicrobium album]